MQVFLVNRSALTPLRSSQPPAQTPVEPSRGREPDSVQLSDTSRKLAAELSDTDQAKVKELEARDQEVRTHEQAHIRASGGHAKGQPRYELEKGPDGRSYAVSGHVDIDTAPVKGDPEATAAKLRAVRRAALAPADPSSQDRKVAAEAAAGEQEAVRALAEEERSGEAAEQDGLQSDAGERTEGGFAEVSFPSGAGEEAQGRGAALVPAVEDPAARNAGDGADAVTANRAQAALPVRPDDPPAHSLGGQDAIVSGADPAGGPPTVGTPPASATGPAQAQPIAERSSAPEAPDAATGPTPSEASQEAARRPSRPPDPRIAFAFDALRQALAIR